MRAHGYYASRRAQKEDPKTKGEVIEQSLDPAAAYREFVKCVAPPNPFHRTANKRPNDASLDFSAASRRPQTRDQPLVTLNRLNTELGQFKVELEELSAASNVNSADWLVANAFLRESSSLERQLAHISEKDNMRPLFSTSFNPEDTTPMASVMSAIERCKRSGERSVEEPERQKWRLYGERGSGLSSDICVVDLDERLARLERTVGNYLSGRLVYPDMVSALAFLGKRLQTVMAETVTRHRGHRRPRGKNQIDQMRSELGRLADTLTRPSQRFYKTYSFTGLGTKEELQEDATQDKELMKLSDVMRAADPSVASLSPMLSRMKTLAPVHVKLSKLADRLNGIAKSKRALLDSLLADRALLNRSMQSLDANMAMIERNIASCTARAQAIEEAM